jgi:hypothetical protein
MPDRVVLNFQREIIRVCESTLRRPLAPHERVFIERRQGLIALESILDFVRGMGAAEMERYLASEQSGGAGPDSPHAKRPGHYLGTIVDGKWWKRYRRDGLFARGNGEWWLEGRTLCFRRLLTREPIRINLDAVETAESGVWHAGRRSGGRTILKLTWEQEGARLTAGFVLAESEAESLELLKKLGLRG